MKKTTEVKGNLNEIKGEPKQQFAILTDSNASATESKQDELLESPHIQHGKAKKENFARLSQHFNYLLFVKDPV